MSTRHILSNAMRLAGRGRLCRHHARRAAARCCAPAARRSSCVIDRPAATAAAATRVRHPAVRRADPRRATVNGVRCSADDLQRHRKRQHRCRAKNPTCAHDADQRGDDHALSRQLPPHRRPQHAGRRRAVRLRRRRVTRRSPPAASATWPSTSSGTQAKLEPPLRNLHRRRRPVQFIYDDRRDHVLRPRPERQRSRRSPGHATCSSAISPTT